MSKIEVLTINPENLIPYVKNSKVHTPEQIDLIAGQISSYGFDQPIVVDKNHVIIKGHGRREAALKLGLKEVPVIVAEHLDEYQAMAARIADNKIAETSWDNDLLKFDLGTLQNQEFELEKLGFDIDSLNLIMNEWISDHEKVENTKENLDGISGKITITCPMEMREELKSFISERINETGFDGIEIN